MDSETALFGTCEWTTKRFCLGSRSGQRHDSVLDRRMDNETALFWNQGMDNETALPGTVEWTTKRHCLGVRHGHRICSVWDQRMDNESAMFGTKVWTTKRHWLGPAYGPIGGCADSQPHTGPHLRAQSLRPENTDPCCASNLDPGPKHTGPRLRDQS